MINLKLLCIDDNEGFRKSLEESITKLNNDLIVEFNIEATIVDFICPEFPRDGQWIYTVISNRISTLDFLFLDLKHDRSSEINGITILDYIFNHHSEYAAKVRILSHSIGIIDLEGSMLMSKYPTVNIPEEIRKANFNIDFIKLLRKNYSHLSFYLSDILKSFSTSRSEFDMFTTFQKNNDGGETLRVGYKKILYALALGEGVRYYYINELGQIAKRDVDTDFGSDLKARFEDFLCILSNYKRLSSFDSGCASFTDNSEFKMFFKLGTLVINMETVQQFELTGNNKLKLVFDYTGLSKITEIQLNVDQLSKLDLVLSHYRKLYPKYFL